MTPSRQDGHSSIGTAAWAPAPRRSSRLDCYATVFQHSFDGILQWAIQSMSRPLAETPPFSS